MLKKRRLFFYTHALVGGGAERVWARLASGFKQRGDEVFFLVDFEAEANRPYLDKDIELIVLPRGHVAATAELGRLIRRYQPDVSLSALSVSNIKHALAARAVHRAHRAVLSYHGFYENEPQRLSNISYRMTPALTRLCGATITVSQSLAQDLTRRFHAPPTRLHTIYNPAAPEPFPPAVTAAELAKRPPLIVAVGRLTPDKNVDALLHAFALLPRSDARLILYGEGPERKNLERLSAELGLLKRVGFAGYTHNVGLALDEARCYALTSKAETFSLSVVEALSHGLPVVATRCGGPEEILNHPDLGCLTPVGDPKAIAAALNACLNAPGDPVPRQRRAQEFSLPMAIEGYDRLIERIRQT